jgi:hypothetical protein
VEQIQESLVEEVERDMEENAYLEARAELAMGLMMGGEETGSFDCPCPGLASPMVSLQ